MNINWVGLLKSFLTAIAWIIGLVGTAGLLAIFFSDYGNPVVKIIGGIIVFIFLLTWIIYDSKYKYKDRF